MTILEEIVRLIRASQQRGVTAVELSRANRQVLGRRPVARPSVVAPPVAMPSEEERRAAYDRYTRALESREQAEGSAAPATKVPAAPARAAATANRRTFFREPPKDGRSFPKLPDLSNASWEQLQEHCLSCKCCRLWETRKNIAFEDGLREAPLMFIGEGPGEDEDLQGKPFVGKAGRLLTAMIKAMGRDRDSAEPSKAVYIANVVKCRPPENRVPFKDEAEVCLGYLRRQIALVKPKVIVLLGGTALYALMQIKGITSHRGSWMEYDGIPVMATFHPAYILRYENFPQDLVATKRLVWNDLKLVMKKLEETA